jgi:8-hydroxy-5-deazaflavin:NADPH oxidoreductase
MELFFRSIIQIQRRKRGEQAMKIAIIGSGNVGSALGKRWAANGHQIIFGSRNPQSEKNQALVKSIGANAHVGPIHLATVNADVVVLATPWGDATEEAIRTAGDLAGKIVIDATNPLNPGLQGLALGHTTSAGEQVAAWATGARVVKAFNTTGANNMLDPNYDGQAATMFLCGDADEAKSVVAGLASEIGFDPVDVGLLSMARELEPLAMLWIHLAYVQGMGRNIALKLLKR